MVKNLNQEKMIIRENERLEDMYRAILSEKKNRVKNLQDHKNKLIEMYMILIKKSGKNKSLVPILFKKMSGFIKKVFLSQKYSYLNLSKILEMINQFITVNSER